MQLGIIVIYLFIIRNHQMYMNHLSPRMMNRALAFFSDMHDDDRLRDDS